MANEIVKRSFGTHDGSFHADEVTACALLLLFDLIDRNKIIRTRDLNKLSTCDYVCDVGNVYNPLLHRFDHHQVDYTGDLSSAGMVLKDLKDKKILSEGTYDFFNRSLILGVDAHDNGRGHVEVGFCSFSQVVSNFVPAVYDAPADIMFKAFEEALDFVVGHLKRLLIRYRYIRSCKEKVKKAMMKGEKYLLFDEALPWMEVFFELGGQKHPALFVVMPSSGHWKLRAIPPSLERRMQLRYPLPEEWAGLSNEELQKVTKIPGAIFCHKGRFISIWQTKEDAIEALKQMGAI